MKSGKNILNLDGNYAQEMLSWYLWGQAESPSPSKEGLKFWLNNIKDCSSRDLPYEERFRIDQYTNIKINNEMI